MPNSVIGAGDVEMDQTELDAKCTHCESPQRV